MFINSKIPVNFKDFKTGMTCFVKKDFIGEVPKWVEESGHFKALVSRGYILAGIQNATDKVLEKKDEELKKVRENVEKQAEKAIKVDEIMNAATQEAEKEAAELGLDEVTKKNLVKDKVEKAMNKTKKD